MLNSYNGNDSNIYIMFLNYSYTFMIISYLSSEKK